MAWIVPGKFLMGMPDEILCSEEYEVPQHEVTLTRPFYLGAHPVTVGQFGEFVRHSGYRTEAEQGALTFVWDNERWGLDGLASWEHPKFAQTDDSPVTCVTWNDARMFCWWLHECDPTFFYRLPTEAEWEFSCRAGARHYVRFHFGDALGAGLANIDGEAPCGGAPVGPFLRRTSPVGSYPPNAFGLFDMHGNVFEMCHDRLDPQFYTRPEQTDPAGPMDGFESLIWFDQNVLGREQVEPEPQTDGLRVTRGGSWLSDGSYCLSAYRTGVAPASPASTGGFRVVAVPRPAFALAK
jgi:formylglycine-generating enzyme required for sulfatase activity